MALPKQDDPSAEDYQRICAHAYRADVCFRCGKVKEVAPPPDPRLAIEDSDDREPYDMALAITGSMWWATWDGPDEDMVLIARQWPVG